MQNVTNALRVKLSNNFRRLKVDPNKTVDVEASTCYFLGVPEIPCDSFRSATRFPMMLGQYLCLIPISQDQFRVCSVPTVLSIVALLCQIAMTLLSFCWLKESGANIFKGGIYNPYKFEIQFGEIQKCTRFNVFDSPKAQIRFAFSYFP